MVSKGGEDVAHHAGAGPGVEDRCSVAGLHVAAKEPGCNCRGGVSPTQHAPLVILRPAIVDLCSLLAALGTERAVQMRPASITQISASKLIVSLPEPASRMPNIACTLHDSASSRQTTKTPVETTRNSNKNPPFAGILGARSAGLEPATFSVRSQTRSKTEGDREGQGETKPCFYRQLSTSKGTGTDRERHGVVVPLWYERRASFRDT